MKIIFSLLALALSFKVLFSCKETIHSRSDGGIKEGFKNPPLTARPKVYWWWLNGNVDTMRLKEELVSIKNAGIGGVDIFEIGVPAFTNPDNMIPAGPAFMGKESQQAIKVAIREAAKLGLEVGINLASSWNAGGSWTKPQHAAKSLYFSKKKLKGPSGGNITLPFPEIPRTDSKGKTLLISYGENGKPVYYQDVAVLAIPAGMNKSSLDTAKIKNITAFFNKEKEELNWPAPAGEWEIYRYVGANSGEELKLPSPNSRGPIIDHYDSAATRAHFMFFINQLKPLIGDFNKTTIKNFYLASYEATGSVWTPSLPSAFKKINGYDIYKFLPALFEKDIFSSGINEKFENDFTKTLSELIINNHYRKAKEISNKHGLKITSEAGGPGKPLHNVPVEALKALGALDVPRGEFWNKHHFYDQDSIDILWLVKEIAAASHIYKRGIVEEEAFTSFQHWREGPVDLKPLADRAFAEGMNRVVVHGFSHNPTGTGFPGIVYHAGTHYNDKRVWWPKIKPFNDYLARISYILQEADFSADVLYYYGDKVPNFVYPKNTQFSVGQGYDYEVINTEILLNDLSVEDGKLALPGGARFSVLYLEPEKEINPDVLQKLKLLAEKGARIIGEKPEKVVSTPAQGTGGTGSHALINQLWVKADKQINAAAGPKGKIFAGLSPLQMLQALKIGPDLDYADKAEKILDYIHYSREEMDFYFIRNTTNKWVSRECYFRQQDKTPEIWDPVTGEVISVPVFRPEGQRIAIPLTLAPDGAFFVVFTKGATSPRYTSVAPVGQHPPLMEFTPNGIYFRDKGIFKIVRSGKPEKIENNIQEHRVTGAWDVTFPKGWGAPEKITLPSLISWTEVDDPGVRYFSGTATYYKTFPFEERVSGDQRVYLDLGDLSKVGEVWLNDKRLGITWAKPFRFDVTGLLKNGKNTLKVEVANTWSNRLTGDAITGKNYTNTNITVVVKVPWAKLPLMESGLIGPVSFQVIKPVK